MKKLLLFSVLALAALVGIAFLAGSNILERAIIAGAETWGPELTQTTVELGDAEVKLANGSCQLQGLVVGNPEGFVTEQSMSVGLLRLALQPRSLFRDKIVIEELVIEQPQLTYEVTLSGANLNRILKNVEEFAGRSASGDAPAANEPGGGKRFEIRLLRITEGQVTIASSLLEGEPIVVPLPPIEIRDIGAGPEGATLADVVRQTLRSINAETVRAAAQSGSSFGEQLQRSADALKRRFGDLLPKAE